MLFVALRHKAFDRVLELSMIRGEYAELSKARVCSRRFSDPICKSNFHFNSPFFSGISVTNWLQALANPISASNGFFHVPSSSTNNSWRIERNFDIQVQANVMSKMASSYFITKHISIKSHIAGLAAIMSPNCIHYEWLTAPFLLAYGPASNRSASLVEYQLT